MNISNSKSTINLPQEKIQQLKKLHVTDFEITMVFENDENEIDKGEATLNSQEMGSKVTSTPKNKKKEESEEIEEKKEESVQGYFNSKVRECNEDVIYENDGDCTVFTTSLPMTPVSEGFVPLGEDVRSILSGYEYEAYVDPLASGYVPQVEAVTEPEILEALGGSDPVIVLVSMDRSISSPLQLFCDMSKRDNYKHIRFLVAMGNVKNLAGKYSVPGSVGMFYVTNNWGVNLFTGRLNTDKLVGVLNRFKKE